MSKLNWTEEFEASIASSAEMQHIPLRKLSEPDAELVRQAVKRHFVIGNPRVWWLGLSKPISKQYDRRSANLTDILPIDAGPIWLIPENERRPVYEVDGSQIRALLDESISFEYNIVAHDCGWLLTETDHDMIYVCFDR